MSPLLLLSIFFVAKTYGINLHSPGTISAGSTYGSYQFNVLHHFSAISPFFESNTEGLSPDPPQGCIVDKAIYQVRHGSIYVNEFDYTHAIEPFLRRLKNSSNSVEFASSSELAFLNHWTSPITDSKEQIAKVSKLGFFESFSLGTRLTYRYPHLMPTTKEKSFKVWGSDSSRTRRSADALFAGLMAGHETIGQVSVVSEDKNSGANTLTPTKACPTYDVTFGTKQAEVWLKNYTVPIIARLNTMVSGYRFLAEDILAMQELCGYETIIKGSSPLCGIFTPEEWLSFEYYFDIKYHYELGYGNDLSPSLGMPWVVATSDLLSRTNKKDQRLYISVSHRQIPPLILTALGLYNDSELLGADSAVPTVPLDHIRYQRTWRTSEFLTFLGQIALERLHCTSAAYNGSFVRILINSKPKPLPGCISGPEDSCPLKQYNNYVKRRSDLFENFSTVCKLNERATNSLSVFTKEEDD